VARHAADQGLAPGERPDEIQYAEAQQAEIQQAGLAEGVLERRWPLRRRFLFIVTAATLCWAVPAVIAYLLWG
jgi:hypothetical protein